MRPASAGDTFPLNSESYSPQTMARLPAAGRCGYPVAARLIPASREGNNVHMNNIRRGFFALLVAIVLAPQPADADEIAAAVAAVEPQVVTWRRDIHAHPELGNREFRTAALVAEHLRGLGLEVETEVAHTGVVGLLRGGLPGPTVALRADMDALPVTERVDLPFASEVTTEYRGQTVGVMHACGHDNHVAILMGVASLLAARREQLAGNVLFIFQPAEEGAPEGEEGGAALMLAEGLFERYRPAAAFGLHVISRWSVGQAAYRSGPTMASSDAFKIFIRGRQTHASRPWQGVDPIVTAAQIIIGLQTIASRKIEVTKAPAVISVGSIKGGIRSNIIPDEVELWGTVRAFDQDMRLQIHREIEQVGSSIAAAAGATAEFALSGTSYPVTVNDPDLTTRSVAVLESVLGRDQVLVSDLITGAEDFSFFAQQVPGFYFFLGATPPDVDSKTAPANHSPLFYADERVLPIGVELLSRLALSYLDGAAAAPARSRSRG